MLATANTEALMLVRNNQATYRHRSVSIRLVTVEGMHLQCFGLATRNA